MKIDLERAHKHCIFNQPEIQRSSLCGCFSCIEVFKSDTVTDWVEEGRGEKPSTALCPHCDIDSVIGDASGIPITVEFLRAMYERWF